MKLLLFVVMLAMFSLGGVVVGQDYQIQIRYNTNLRSTYSLNGDIVETATAGTTLLVIGDFNRWLNIRRNGNAVWNCSFNFDWIVARWVYSDTGGQCGAPIQQVVDGVIVEGSSEFNARIIQAMNLVKSRSPEWYSYSITGARKIREFPWTRGDGTLEQSYNLTTGFVARSSISYLAATFVHENCHIQRWLNGFDVGELEDLAEDPVCDTVATNALNVIAPGAPYPRHRINEFLRMGLPYDVNASAHREWERAVRIYSQRS